MMQAKELLISTRKFAAEDRRKSWFHLLFALGIYLALVSVILLDIPLGFRIFASLISALVLVRLFIFVHDYQHGAIFQKSPLGALLMNAIGTFSLAPPNIWRYTHDTHHKNNSKIPGKNVGSYPIMTTEMYAKASTWQRFKYASQRHPLTLAFGYVTVFIVGLCSVHFLRNPKKYWDGAVALLLHAALIAWLSTFGWTILLLVLLVPFLVSSAAGSYLFYAQHNYPGVRFFEEKDWNLVDAALQSSSFFRMSPLMYWFTGNIAYHHVHHLNAKIPFYRLPEAMGEIKELQTPGTTSLRPRDILACLRLKLWDQEKGKMVSFRGV